MEYKYFTLDKNPKQFKRISIGEYSIELRIEWNTRSKAWYVLGYSGDEIVISNVKLTPNQLYSIDIDSEYDLPYMIGIIPKYTNYDWDTETTFLIVDNPLSNTVEGLTVDGGVIKRSIATSSDTHSRKALKGTENKYLFDVVSITQETGITIVCNGAASSFKTVNLPQGRWDFTINGLRTITADTQAFISLMNDYGVQIVDVGNNEYLWANNSDHEIKIEGLYPYAAGYDFNVAESSNESAKIHSVDNNGWVNRFTVCLSPFVDTVWEIYKTEVSEDYNNLVFKGRKSLTGVKPSEEEALLEKYKSGLDVYSATIVNELTGVSDWVLDSDNNQIKWIEGGTIAGRYIFLCTESINGCPLDSSIINPKPFDPNASFQWRDLCASQASDMGGIVHSNSTSGTCIVTVSGSNTFYGIGSRTIEGEEGQEKYLPLETIVDQVISNAKSGNVNAEELLNSLNKYDSYAEVEILPLIVDRYEQGLDVYSSGIVNELIGVSDWILDSDNNRIKWNETTEVPVDTAYWVTQINEAKSTVSMSDSCTKYMNHNAKYISYGSGLTYVNPRASYYLQTEQQKLFWCEYDVLLNGAYQSTVKAQGQLAGQSIVEGEEKYLPLPVVAQQVISNAESGNVDAQKVALSAALSPTLVRSLSDSDMQQWQAVKDAIGGLTGVTEWTFDNVDNQIEYYAIDDDPTSIDPSSKFIYRRLGGYATSCDRNYDIKNYQSLGEDGLSCYLSRGHIGSVTHVKDVGGMIEVRIDGSNGYDHALYAEIENPYYDPNYVAPTVSLTYQKVAERIAQNSKSVDQSIVLPANAYITEALLKFTDVDSIKSQFEANKQPK